MKRPEMHVTLRQLRVFLAVAREGGYTRAGELLHLTQPAVSMQVRSLTDAVGMALFEQVGKRVFLTEAGRELEEACREMFAAWDRFEMRASDLKGLKRGKLKIAVVTTAKYFIPRLLGEFWKRYPDIDIGLEIANRDRVVERLEGNVDDLYIMGLPPKRLDLELRPFLDNPLVLVAPTGHPLAGKTKIALSSLAAERFIFREPGSGTRLATQRFFKEAGFAANVKMEIGTNEAIKQGVAGGLGLAVLSRHSLAQDPAQDGLAVLDVRGFPIERAWYIVYPKGKRLSVVAAAFCDFLLERVPRGSAGAAKPRVKSKRSGN